MSVHQYIYDKVVGLVELYGTRDPRRLANDCDIHLYCEPLGNLSGFFAVVAGRRCLFYNQSLDEITAREVIAHELAHALLHQDDMANFDRIRECTLLKATTITEQEANIFAAELLLADEEVLDLLSYYTDEQMAKSLGCNLELLLYKLQSLNVRQDLHLQLRYPPKSDYLAR